MNSSFSKIFITLICSYMLGGCMEDDEPVKTQDVTEQLQTQPEKPPEPKIEVEEPDVNEKRVQGNGQDVSLDDLESLLMDMETKANNEPKVDIKKETYVDDTSAAKMITNLLKNSVNYDVNHVEDVEKKKCLGKISLSVDVNEINSILQKQLSVKKFNKLTEFVSSDVGGQFPQYADYVLNNAPSEHSEADEKNLEEYIFSAEGQYLSDIRLNTAFRLLIKRQVEAKSKECDVDIKDLLNL